MLNRQFSQLRAGALVSLVVGFIAAALVSDDVSLFPPGISSRGTNIASATTQVVIDTPKSAILDVRQDSYAIQGLTERTVLVGNVITSVPVRKYVAQRASIPVESLQVAAPLTPDQPRARAELGVKRGPGELVKSNDQYRLSIRANPTVPVLTLYAQAPSPKIARDIADGAVEGLRRYLDQVATAQQTPQGDRIRVLQLGLASPSGVINKGARWQLAILAFLGAFCLSCACFVFGRRVRHGYRLAGRLERSPAG